MGPLKGDSTKKSASRGKVIALGASHNRACEAPRSPKITSGSKE